MEKREKKLMRKRNFWWGCCMLLFGVLLGFLLAPTKHGNRFHWNFGGRELPDDVATSIGIIGGADGPTQVDAAVK